MKNKQNPLETFQKSYNKQRKRQNRTTNTHYYIHDHSVSWLCTGTSIKRGWVKLV